MPEPDPLTTIFARLRAGELPITPPGVAATRRTVERRRLVRTLAVSFLAVLVVGLPPLLLADRTDRQQPTDQPTISDGSTPTSSSAGGTFGPAPPPPGGGGGGGGNCAGKGVARLVKVENLTVTVEFTPTAAGAQPSAGASATAEPEPTVAPSEEPSPSPGASPSASAPPDPGSSASLPCRGVRVPVYWAVYQPDDLLKPENSGTSVLNRNQPRLAVTVPAPPCRVWYVGYGNGIPEPISPDADRVLANGQTDCPEGSASPTVSPSPS